MIKIYDKIEKNERKAMQTTARATHYYCFFNCPCGEQSLILSLSIASSRLASTSSSPPSTHPNKSLPPFKSQHTTDRRCYRCCYRCCRPVPTSLTCTGFARVRSSVLLQMTRHWLGVSIPYTCVHLCSARRLSRALILSARSMNKSMDL